MKRPPTRVRLLGGPECLILHGVDGSPAARKWLVSRPHGLPAAATNRIEVEDRPCATGCGWLMHNSSRWTPRVWFLAAHESSRRRGPLDRAVLSLQSRVRVYARWRVADGAYRIGPRRKLVCFRLIQPISVLTLRLTGLGVDDARPPLLASVC